MFKRSPKEEAPKEDRRANKVERARREHEIQESKRKDQKGPPPLAFRFFF